MGEGPYGKLKPPTKMAKTFNGLISTLGPIPEATGFGSANQDEASPAQRQPSGKSPMTETSFTSN